MSDRQITIAIDAMGGENSPFKIISGTKLFLKNYSNVKVVFFGEENELEKQIKLNKFTDYNYEIVHTNENVQDDDSASTILRNRKNSSIYKGLEYVKNTPNSGFVSAGNTAALMILSRLILGTIKGIDRPAICSLIPNKNSSSVMLDLGANVNVNASNIFQFALMGYSFFSAMKISKTPKIGIINIGTEDNKGLEILQEASDLINNSFLKQNYIGFIEPNKIYSGDCDIMVSDGYTGNIMLKTMEGLSKFITNNLKNVFEKSVYNKIAYKILEKDLNAFKDRVNPEKYNGATLIGLNGISIKSHGSCSPYAFNCALIKCFDFILNDLNKKIVDNFNNL